MTAAPASQAPSAASGPTRFSWQRTDIESRFGLKGGRYTRVNNLMCVILALVLTVITYAIMSFYPKAYIVQFFTERGPTQYVAVMFTYWTLVTLLIKWSKIRHQATALHFTDLVPASGDFVLSSATVGMVLAKLRNACDDTTRYVLFNRIDIGLSNLKNMGQITDVEGAFQGQASTDEDMMEGSYSLLKGLIWAIPVLGFIGTVLGLGQAIGEFSGVLADAQDLSQIKPALQRVTSGLSTAFDTTMLALTAALFMQMLLTFIRKAEEEMMDECKEYCQRNIIGRLRITRLE
jgi:biopolymer transport protein ExbB/TolQ